MATTSKATTPKATTKKTTTRKTTTNPTPAKQTQVTNTSDSRIEALENRVKALETRNVKILNLLRKSANIRDWQLTEAGLH